MQYYSVALRTTILINITKPYGWITIGLCVSVKGRSLSEERDKHAGSNGRTDDARYVRRHAVVQYMVLRVILRRDAVTYTAGHRNGRKTGCTYQWINLLLGKQVPYLYHANTAGNRERKGTETACDDAQSLYIDEGLDCHRCSDTQSEENGGGIHDAIRCSIKQS